jgi:Uma2 family endonuclease
MVMTKPAGSWRYDDLIALPDDGNRFEIIAGVLHELPPPGWDHAVTVAALMSLLGPLFAQLGGVLVTAPVGVFFRGADRVQPDLRGLLPGSSAAPSRRGVEGPPDLLIEVLSPSNRGYDRLTKRELYTRAGVREYWLVDPVTRTIEILGLGDGEFQLAAAAAEDETISSPLLGGAEFPLSTIFAQVRGFDAD